MLAVQVGFTGPCALAGLEDAATRTALRRALGEEQLALLPAHLGLDPAHRLVGVSQLAIGADTLFTEACMALGWPQLLMLPQPVDEFLAAQGSRGPC